MTKADKKALAIAEEFGRQDRKKQARSELANAIYQIARTLPEDLGTPVIRKVLACKVLAIAHELNITQWCKEAGISRPTWYSTIAHKDFGDACTRVAKICLGPQAIEVTQAMIRKAKYGSSDGMGDSTAQMAILQRCGITAPIKEKDSSGGDTSVTIYNDFSELARVLENAAAGAKASAASDRGPFSTI